MGILTGVRCNLSVVLTCISFITRGGEQFFMYLLAFVLLPLKIPFKHGFMCPFIQWGVDSLGAEYYEFLVYSGC
jgi:hypothetical protein